MISRHINPEVAHALQNNIPVVALESTIITHGMPYPENLKMVLEVEEIIRDNHAVPATIAVVDGVVKIGLSKDEVRNLSEKKDVIKLSRNDLAYAISCRKTGATTVAATMILAASANIKVFATGGVGGVQVSAFSVPCEFLRSFARAIAFCFRIKCKNDVFILLCLRDHSLDIMELTLWICNCKS